LTRREQDVIELRFGYKDGRHRTLDEVGEIFELTRERIRQIEGKALRKLRKRLKLVNKISSLSDVNNGDNNHHGSSSLVSISKYDQFFKEAIRQT
jgi:hypothetical protein